MKMHPGPCAKGAWKLVNLAEDIGEKHNLANSHPDRFAELHQLHDDWIKSLE